MNHVILAGEISSPAPQPGSKPRCRAVFTVPALQDGRPPAVIQVEAWGQAADNLSGGGLAVITGRINLQPLPGSVELFIAANNVLPARSLDGLETHNHIALVGRAGRDPEVRYLESGSVVANLSLAVNRRGRDEPPNWFNLQIWGKQAQVAADYVRKGSLLGITGSFGLEFWTDRATAEERSKAVVRVDQLSLLGSRRDSQRDSWGGDASDEEVPF